MTLPELIIIAPESRAKAFKLKKAPGAVYFMLDIRPDSFLGSEERADKIMNVLKFGRDCSVVVTKLTFKLEDEFEAITLAELGDEIKQRVESLKAQTDNEVSFQTLEAYRDLGFF